MNIYKNKIIVLYDQDCGFCNKCKSFSLNKNKKLSFIGINSKKGAEIFKERKITKRIDTIFTLEEKQYFIKSEGVARIFLTFNWPWKVLYYIWKVTPLKFSDFIYDTVSKHKGRLTDKKTCKIK